MKTAQGFPRARFRSTVPGLPEMLLQMASDWQLPARGWRQPRLMSLPDLLAAGNIQVAARSRPAVHNPQDTARCSAGNLMARAAALSVPDWDWAADRDTPEADHQPPPVRC